MHASARRGRQRCQPPRDDRGNPRSPNPNIDRLAAEGVIFLNQYVSSSVCTPSRYSVLTGNYAGRSSSYALENTIVFYFDDHGVEDAKGSLYDAGVRSVSLAWSPRYIQGGRQSKVRVSNIDFAPTIMDLCGMSVFSVPAHGGPDYVRNLHAGSKTDAKGVYSYHTAKYGPLEKFGYKDFIPLFTVPKFNADEWVGLMHEAGAKFGGICLVHHDGFLLWDSKVSRWNAKNMGPGRDIYGEIAQAVRKYDDMKRLATFHHGRTFGYATGGMKDNEITDEMRRTWDVFDPQYADFYWNEQTGSVKEFADQWKAKITEVIDNYHPDLLWFDGLGTSMRNDHPPESYIGEVFAHYFNRMAANGQSVTICNKHAGWFNFPESFGLPCYENGRDMPIGVGPWFLIDRAIAYPWSYVNDKKYRDGTDYHVRSLVDVVSRGGIFLLSLTPKGDGSIPPEEQEIMRGIGRWLKVNGEAIYGTRPWKIHAEGPTFARGMKRNNKGEEIEQWDWRQEFTAEDVRFTIKGNTLYAIAPAWPESGELTIKSLVRGRIDVSQVSLLGSNEIPHGRRPTRVWSSTCRKTGRANTRTA